MIGVVQVIVVVVVMLARGVVFFGVLTDAQVLVEPDGSCIPDLGQPRGY